ncbi:hypothetical protein LTR35_001732 [Friedmanniomyces endolithicus]|uniref:Protein kinase domain-containing protein n=1 Tax=Friedmanniomyces endolithicus TaxID=329885 RepID=A0AAN6J9L6_9PEZI|nr:hypothetical protein LTR35_001732 [Friedmanniomyces endolithicus]KAK0296817.1 hypothetical protein LTS00_004617 [Friedmanniomyces endolithicus]KAK0321506.1 hypothetical protein LTR82_007474 [Friedmanniomyces endolithicus]KAK1011186.1 hypothetical protein LTR54_005104 [Friedmanniomyces endolithicus]
MGTRSYADVAPTAATIALNAYIFGYGGHSLVTPHTTLKQLWWTDERIERKVTRSFVVSKLRGEERQFLDKPLAFGELLTDDTYMEWILERAKRLFLVLTEIGVPDQIFGCIDASWGDGDLPMTLDDIKNLELAYENDENLNRRFYDTQFVYLLRELKAGTHIEYGPKEHIPMEYVNTLPPAVSLQSWDRVHFPGRPEEVFMRRKYALTDKDTGQTYHNSFSRDLQRAKALKHEHIAGLWGSYVAEDAGYVLSDFVGEHTLATFIDHRTPSQFLRVSPTERPVLLLEWMHCLADALASLHHRGVPHSAIRPSHILIDHDNHIAFADVGSVRTFQRGKKPYQTETYDYAAPESQICKAPFLLTSSLPQSSLSAFGKFRKMSSSTSNSSTSSSTGSSIRSNSLRITVPGSPVTPPSLGGRTNSLSTILGPMSSSSFSRSSSSSFRNFSRHIRTESCTSPTFPKSPMSLTPVTILPRPSTVTSGSMCDLPDAPPEMSDIYSLGCVFLDILTFMLRGKLVDFVRFRSTRLQVSENRQRSRTDQSFHCNPDKTEAWLDVLREDSQRLGAAGNQVHRGVPALLDLVRRMLLPNALLRPTAVKVRDRIQDVLVDQCGIERLCCAGREWDVSPMPALSMRDSFSIATATIGSPGIKFGDDPHNDSVCGDQRSVLARTESEPVLSSRRTSSASKATAKLGSWRRAFTRAR